MSPGCYSVSFLCCRLTHTVHLFFLPDQHTNPRMYKKPTLLKVLAIGKVPKSLLDAHESSRHPVTLCRHLSLLSVEDVPREVRTATVCTNSHTPSLACLTEGSLQTLPRTAWPQKLVSTFQDFKEPWFSGYGDILLFSGKELFYPILHRGYRSSSFITKMVFRRQWSQSFIRRWWGVCKKERKVIQRQVLFRKQKNEMTGAGRWCWK